MMLQSIVGCRPTGVPDSPRSVSSAGSFETLTSAGGGSSFLDMDCNGSSFFTESAEADGGNSGEAIKGLGVVDTTLLDSWKELPWQARLCPRAIEEREFVRWTSALEIEVTLLHVVFRLLASQRGLFHVQRLASWITAGWRMLLW